MSTPSFFDGQFNAPEMEEKVLAYWDEIKAFEKSLEKTKDGLPYTFYDGPPFATGIPHYGHILASTIKDVIPRYQTMKGRFVRRRWGWDCHGLPIEEIVERKLGISGKKQIEEIGIGKFNETCRSMVLTYVDEWGKTVRRIARWVDFDNSYKTMDREFMESVWWGFKQIYDKGLVYEGRKVLMYCPRCETPISNFEVAMDNSYKDVIEEAVTVKFPVKGEVNTFILAWTTTPWTLPGNVALAVGADIDYVKAESEGATYIIAKEKIALLPNATIKEEMKGSALVGMAYEPVFDVPAVHSDKTYKVYAADFVNTEDGTGVVHTAVVYGEDDYQLGIREGLPIVPLLDEKGKYNELAPEFLRGQYIKDAERFIKKDLEARGFMFKREQHQHSYPHCWRCSTPLYYNAIPAWFVNIQEIKAGLLQTNNDQMNWYPDHLKHGRYEKSVGAAPDWNISRNRYWGNPIPIWKCEDCKEIKVVGSIAELGQDIKDLHRPYIDEVILKCEKCGGNAKRTPEVFDSWVEAGSMPFAEYHYPFENKEVFESRFPAQFVAEYIAQTRAWFYLLHVVGYTIFGRAPVENLVTTGTILAEDGSKMSKSKNNFPDPWIIINKHGVDALRFYLMNSVVMQADNLSFNTRDLETASRKVVMILQNVYNYFATYAKEKNWSAAEISGEGKSALDAWIMARTKELVNEVTQYLDAYDTVWATRSIEAYIDDLSTWYLRRSRGRDDKAFFETMYQVLITVSQVIAPVMPFLSEAIYLSLVQGFNGKGVESVHLTDWPQAGELNAEEKSVIAAMAAVREAASLGQSIRKTITIPVRQPLPALAVKLKSGVELSEELSQILCAELNIKAVEPALLTTTDETVKTIQGAKLVEMFALSTVITPELKREGLARNLERGVQELRKKMGLTVGEMVELKYQTDDADLEQAFNFFDKDKTYVAHITKATIEAGEQVEIEGKTVSLEIVRT